MSFLDKFGPRLERFAKCPIEEDYRINILEGSVRSGKTWALHAKILQACRYRINGWRFITGQSKDTIFTNVLNDLFEIVGPKYYNYNHQTGLLRLLRSNWKVMGAKDEGSEKFLRGATIGIAICDELVLMPKGFFQMLLTRMSPEGARLFGTTNPDQPMHWLKTDYLDDEKLRKQKLLWSMHVTMDDNPNLTKEYVDSQKALYKGLFYRRYILGEWTMAEGAIYRDCWDDSLIFDDLPIPIENTIGWLDHWISVDCGVDHPQVYLEYRDDGTTIWVTREWYWDSRAQMRQKTDAQYADDLIEFMGPQGGCQVIVPPECLSFKAELVGRGIWVSEADNEVLPGIQTVSGLMNTKKLRVHRTCKNLLREIETYCWDEKAAARAVEQPLKKNDDAVDALRYGLYAKIPRWRFAA